MYVAILSTDKMRAKRIGERILDTCLSNGCYSTFISCVADRAFLKELDRRKFNTVIISAESSAEIELARMIAGRQPKVKIVLLGGNKEAIKGYDLNADYCATAEPKEEDLERIAKIIFPTPAVADI